MRKNVKKLFPVTGIIILFGLTLLSTVVGVTKIVNTINKSPTNKSFSQIPEVLGGNIDNDEKDQEKKENNLPTPSIKNIAQKPNNKTNTVPLQNESSSSGKCIVTLFGAQYDITELRKTHSGGDMFVCNTDMTSSYQSRHGTNLSRMAQYKVNSNGTSLVLPTSIPANQQTNSQSGRCIITLFGEQYDITQLKSTHSGGDVFACGTDMTSSYQSRHGTNLTRMVQYKINQTQTGSPQPVPSQQAPRPTITPSSQSGKCIVTLFGSQYDVTNLRKTHSGGDMFVCNTDMTASYQSRHGTNLSRMAPYKVTQAVSPTPTPFKITPTPTKKPQNREDEDDRDEIEKEENLNGLKIIEIKSRICYLNE